MAAGCSGREGPGARGVLGHGRDVPGLGASSPPNSLPQHLPSHPYGTCRPRAPALPHRGAGHTKPRGAALTTSIDHAPCCACRAFLSFFSELLEQVGAAVLWTLGEKEDVLLTCLQQLPLLQKDGGEVRTSILSTLILFIYKYCCVYKHHRCEYYSQTFKHIILIILYNNNQ